MKLKQGYKQAEVGMILEPGLQPRTMNPYEAKASSPGNKEMTLRAGYKQTEVGVIPEDWDVKRIAELSEVIRGASPRPKGDKRYYGGAVPRLMVQDVTRDGMYVTPKIDFLTDDGAKLSRPCKKGTLILVCSGTVGVPSILAVDACIHDGFLALINPSKNISRDYLFQFFASSGKFVGRFRCLSGVIHKSTA